MAGTFLSASNAGGVKGTAALIVARVLEQRTSARPRKNTPKAPRVEILIGDVRNGIGRTNRKNRIKTKKPRRISVPPSQLPRYTTDTAFRAVTGLIGFFGVKNVSTRPLADDFDGSGAMRRAKSYSIIDHQLFHGGFFQRLNHQALAMYLFLVVVGDRNGKSFYGDRTIMEILRLDGKAFAKARSQLIDENLIRHSPPYWWVTNIGGHANSTSAPAPCEQTAIASDKATDWEWQRARVKDLIRQLSPSWRNEHLMGEGASVE